MLSKIILYTTIASSFFAASAFSTIQVTKQMNKTTPIPEEVSIEEEEESEKEESEEEIVIPVREMSDTERFINSLTTFGNMEASINASIVKDELELTIKGDVFVSLESLTNPKVNADLIIENEYKDIAINATYINDVIYLNVLDNNLKLNISSINDLMDIFNNMDLGIELPSTFSNIDTDKLLENLGNMEVSKDDKEITYTCNLLEALPPITFKSDLNYNMTGLALSNFEIEGFKIDVNATTNILGMGHNKVNVPSNAEEYTDVSNYFSIIPQVMDIINEKQGGLTYNVNIKKDNVSFLSTKGRMDINLNEDLSLRVNGNIFNKDASLFAPYLVDYSNNRLTINYNDMVKAYYNLNNLNELTSSINDLLSANEIKSLLNNLNKISIPLIDMINDKDIKGIFDTYECISLKDDLISLSMNNSLFSSNNSNFTINLNLDQDNGITSIDIVNLSYNSYSLDLSLGIEEYKTIEDIDTSSYIDLSNAHYVISQIKDYIVNKQVAGDISLNIKGFDITGYIQVDIESKDINADITISKDNKAHNIKVTIDNDNAYLIYNDTLKLQFSNESLNSIIDSLMTIVTTDNAFKDLLGEIKTTELLDKLLSKDLDTIIFTKYVNELKPTDTGISTSINKDLLGLKDDLKLDITFVDYKINSINVNASINDELSLLGSITLKEYNSEYRAISDNGGWIGASSTSNIVKYVADLDNDTKLALINQIKDIIENKQLEVNYDIDVTKDNTLVFNIEGDIDVDFSNIESIKDLSLAFNGNMTNTDNNLDSDVSIKLYNGTLYFNYNDKLLLSYSIDDLTELISLIKDKLNSTSPIDITSLLDNIFPNTSTASSPLFNVIKNKDYLSLLSFYKDAYIDTDNGLNIVIDGDILGDSVNDITFTLDTSSNGIESIKLNNINAFGYVLDINLGLSDYNESNVVMTETEMNSYTDMKYISNIIDGVYNLTQKDKFDITLSGKVNLGKGDIIVNGSSYFEIGESLDYGVANISLTDSKNKTHNIKIDVNRNKVSKEALDEEKEQALASSQVLLTYNNNLKGKLNLLSVTDTVKLIKTLAEEGNPLLAKLKEVLSKDTSQSTINKLMNGEIEAILYDNSLNNITYDESTKSYVIELNGDLFKKDNEQPTPVYLSINMNDDHSLKGIGIKGSLMGYYIDLSLGIKEATENTLGRLTYNSSYYDFSSIDNLVDYLFNTAKNNDFTLGGTVNINILDIADLSTINLKSYVKLEDGTDGKKHTTAKVIMSNISVPIVAESSWDSRTFTMYMTDDEVILEVHTVNNRSEWDWKKFKYHHYEDHTVKSRRLTMEQFTDDIAYYLVNYGLGVKTGTFFGKSLDMRNQTTSEVDADYSKILSSYSTGKNSNNNPTWTVGINLAELAGTSVLGDLSATITGNKDNKLLSNINASVPILGGLVNATINADLQSVDTLNEETIVTPMKEYISTYENKAFGEDFVNEYTIQID